MAIGYACLSLGIPQVKFRSCRKDGASPDRLNELIANNLAVLDRMLDYNHQRNIRLFRISSDIIPFGSHPVNQNRWWQDFETDLQHLGQKAKNYGMRLSMHPGQYTVLNSPRPDVVHRAVADLTYHNRFLDSLGLDSQHKLILHIGGVYGDKEVAIARFKENYLNLDVGIKNRLVIENDDKSYTIADVLDISQALDIPAVYDNLHHQVNPADSREDAYWVKACKASWKLQDGRQKVHYSQQAPGKRAGSHSATIALDSFMDYYHAVDGESIDIMLEVKDKNLSAEKAIQASQDTHIRDLEQAWARYKYWVLEHSPKKYLEIRQLLKDKSQVPVLEFYRLVDQALETTVQAGPALNAGQHIWGHFKKQASQRERESFQRYASQLESGGPSRPLKRHLWRLVQKYGDPYLEKSLYFKDFI